MALRWANKSLNGLHDDITGLLIFDTTVLLKYIKLDTERQSFLAQLKTSETDDDLKDLREQYTAYKKWVWEQDKAVKQLAASAQAYNNLFSLEMRRLYQDVWNKSSRNERSGLGW